MMANLEPVLRRVIRQLVREELDRMVDRPAVRCAATTRAGHRCSMDAMEGDEFCRVHRRLNEKETRRGNSSKPRRANMGEKTNGTKTSGIQ